MASTLQNLFQWRVVQKQYIAVVYGHMTALPGLLIAFDESIGKDPFDERGKREVQNMVSKTGKNRNLILP